MSETVNQGTNPTAGNEPEKTFTQAQLDAIVADRLSRERGKYADYEDLKAKAARLDKLEESNKSALEKAQGEAADYKARLEALQKQNRTRDARDKVSAETGVPASLLTGEDEESCRKQAEALKQWRGKDPNYPDTGDAGGVQQPGGAGKTRDQFAEWFSSALHTKGE